MTALQPKKGRMTFDIEGVETPGIYFSRKLHVPTKYSGVTLGRGYDMKKKSSSQIRRDLVGVGVNSEKARLISNASKLSGNNAKLFITSNNLEGFRITQGQQVRLFKISYNFEESEAKRLCTKADVVDKYGICIWSDINPTMREIIVDLKFRGDYAGKERLYIQRYIATNDTRGFLKALSNKSIWKSSLSNTRFLARINYFKENVVHSTTLIPQFFKDPITTLIPHQFKGLKNDIQAFNDMDAGFTNLLYDLGDILDEKLNQ